MWFMFNLHVVKFSPFFNFLPKKNEKKKSQNIETTKKLHSNSLSLPVCYVMAEPIIWIHAEIKTFLLEKEKPKRK
jgi:hypothetical protein